MRFFSAEESHRGAVRKYCPNSRFLKGVDRGVGMCRRIDDVAPVEQRRNAGIDLIKRDSEIADICVFRLVEADDLANQHAEVVVEGPVCGDTSQRGLPEMDMAVDKARHRDHAAAVYLAYGPTADVLPTATILPLSMSRSPDSMIPSVGSIETIVAPLIRIRGNIPCALVLVWLG